VNRDSGTDSTNGGWLRRLVRPNQSHLTKSNWDKTKPISQINKKQQQQLIQLKLPATTPKLETPGVSFAKRFPNLGK
jgi:hypothetical protein